MAIIVRALDESILEDFENSFTYSDGELYWRAATNRIMVGSKAGTLRSDGYVGVYLNTKYHFVHRVIWQMHNGLIPSNLFIDHIDSNKANNKLSNLRLCSHTENSRNRLKMSNNKSGYKGVCWHKQKGKWQVQIKIDGKNKHLGFFYELLDAAACYANAADALYGDFGNY